MSLKPDTYLLFGLPFLLYVGNKQEMFQENVHIMYNPLCNFSLKNLRRPIFTMFVDSEGVDEVNPLRENLR